MNKNIFDNNFSIEAKRGAIGSLLIGVIMMSTYHLQIDMEPMLGLHNWKTKTKLKKKHFVWSYIFTSV